MWEAKIRKLKYIQKTENKQETVLGKTVKKKKKCVAEKNRKEMKGKRK